jgi:hypothetical protein
MDRPPLARNRHGPLADLRRLNANAPPPSATTRPPPTSTPTGEPDPRPVSFTRESAACELDDELVLAVGAVVAGTVVVVDGESDEATVVRVVDGIVGAAGASSGTVDRATVVVVDEMHVAAGSALQFGFGSFGFALPFGVHRQPSAIDALTRVDGLTFEYVQPFAAVPCQ